MSSRVSPLSTTVSLDHVYLVGNSQRPPVLHPLGEEPTEFVVDQGYSVIARDWEQDRDFIVGVIETQRLLLGAALNERMHWFDVADATSQDLMDLVELVFDPEEVEFTPEFAAAVDTDFACADDLVYVPTDDILDHPWGPHALRTLMQHSSGAQLFVVGVSGLQGAVNGEEYQAALRRAAILMEMGFDPYPNSPFFFFDLHMHLPELPEHLSLEELLPVEVEAVPV